MNKIQKALLIICAIGVVGILGFSFIPSAVKTACKGSKAKYDIVHVKPVDIYFKKGQTHVKSDICSNCPYEYFVTKTKLNLNTNYMCQIERETICNRISDDTIHKCNPHTFAPVKESEAYKKVVQAGNKHIFKYLPSALKSYTDRPSSRPTSKPVKK